MQHENCRGVAKTSTSMKVVTRYLTVLLIIIAKLSIVDVCGSPTKTLETVQHEQSAIEKSSICQECNRRRMQMENIATCKSAINLKRVQHEKKNNKTCAI